MMNTIRKRAAMFGAVASLSLALAACSGADEVADTDDTAAEAPAEDESMDDESMDDEAMDEGDAESALTLQPVGEACSQVPADGEGSSEGMADDPVAIAASNNPLLSTLVTAVGEAGLVDTLNGLEGATVFAPINPAFDAFTQEELDALLADTEQLTAVLTTHVVGENLTLDDLSDGDTLTTVAENELTVSFADGSELPTITSPSGNEAVVVCGNVQTANATVFLIDTVLLPSS